MARMTMEQQTPTRVRDGHHDFDFLVGTWTIRNRRRPRPRTGEDEWEEFDGRAVVRPAWGGLANVDEIEAESPSSGRLRGLTVRLYNRATGQWSLYWMSDATTVVGPPNVGEFRDGRG